MSELDRLLPEGAVVEHSIVVVSYFDAEGEMGFYGGTAGEAHVTTLLGLLEWAKIQIASVA